MSGIREAIITPRCLQTWRVAGPCQRCGQPAADPAHVTSERIWCADCCCGTGLFSTLPAEAMRAAEQPAEQGRLF